MRASTDPEFAKFLLRIGYSKEEKYYDGYIKLPDNTIIPYEDDIQSLEK